MHVDRQEIDILYGKIYKLNDRLLQRSEKEPLDNCDYSCEEIFDFYITSHALNYLKCLYFGDLHDVSLCLSARCIIEGLTLKTMCRNGTIGTLNKELLQKQVFLLEYYQYKNFMDISEEILLPEKLQQDWQYTCDFYRKKLKDIFSEKEIKNILKSNIPFLCKPKTNYRTLVEKTFGEEITGIYGFFSAAIHPSLNESHRCTLDGAIQIVFLLLYKEYYKLSETSYSLSADYISTNAAETDELLQLMKQEQKILDEIADVFIKCFSQNNYISNTLKKIGYMLPALAVDRQLGLTEQIKCKWKILIEHCAALYFIYFKCFGQNERYDLLSMHSTVQLQRNFNYSINLDEAYNVYCKIYDNCCEKKVFENNFIKQLGYMIDDKGYVPSLKEIVKQFIDLLKTSNTGIPLDRKMLLDYIECQMLSHANGYMWFANAGAFNDVQSIFGGLDASLFIIFNGLLDVFTKHRDVENSKDYKMVINILRNSLRRLKEISLKIMDILSLPTVKKWHLNE